MKRVSVLLICLLAANSLSFAGGYKRTGASHSFNKFISESPRIVLGDSDSTQFKVTKISSGKVIHRFFDTSPVSPSGRYVALFRFKNENVSPKPGDVGDVILVDLQTGKEKVVAQSHGFEMQLGANVQWGISDDELIFNDVDTATWQAYAVVLNHKTNRVRKLGGTVFMVSNDGKKIASYNLLSSRYAQVGYGVVVPNGSVKRNVGPVETDGLDITDVKTGKSSRIISIKDVYNQTTPSIRIPEPDKYEYYFFQVKWNPQGTRLLTTLQWSPIGGGARRRTVITMRADGTDVRTAITADQWAQGGHHVNWTPDGEHLSMNLNINNKPGLELVVVKYDGTDMKEVFHPGSGHPSYHPKALPLIVTDAYPDESITKRDGTVPIRLLNTSSGLEENVYSIYVSTTQGEFRIDPHPAWDRSGRYVVFNGFDGNTRNVYIADLKEYLNRLFPETVLTDKKRKK